MNKYVKSMYLWRLFQMYESTAIVGERGQITIPKTIRELNGIKAKDRVVVKMENEKIVVEKPIGKKEKERLIKEYYQKYSKLEEEIEDEWKYVSKEADEMLDDY
ncbi:MAG: AbrB/MazE/SpoVT family DNA-binding domain-containing protein [Candidatus Diapherotrites archaeon]